MKRTPPTASPSSASASAGARKAAGSTRVASQITKVRPATASGSTTSASARGSTQTPRAARKPAPRSSSTVDSDGPSSLTDAPAAGDDDQPPLIPDARPQDRLSRTITPILYIILNNLTVSELCCLCRASRFLFSIAAGEEHDGLWKKRFLKAVAARTAKAKAAGDEKPVIEPDFITPTGLSFVGRAYFARKVEEVRRAKFPASLPQMNPYRHALLGWTRELRASKFAKFCAARDKQPQYFGITKRTVEELKMGVQLHLYVGSTALGSVDARGKKTLWQRDVKAHLHDHTIVATWRTDDRLTIRRLQGMQLIGHSGAAMRELELTEVISAQEREWKVLRNATSDHTVSLLEWRPMGVRTSRPAARSSGSASATSSSVSDTSEESRRDMGLEIPGLICTVVAGVWGPVSTPRGVNDHEVAFLWLSLPHSALLSRLPRPQLALKSAPRKWEVRRDDVDSQNGLRAALHIALRSTTRTICSWSFKELLFELVQPASGRGGPKEARLELSNIRDLLPPWNKLPGLPWTTSLFSGRFPRSLWFDFTLRTPGDMLNGDRPIWIGSSVLELNEMRPDEEGRGVNLHMDELAAQALRYSAQHRTDFGRIEFQLSHTPGVTTAEEIGANGRQDSPRGSSSGEGVGATRLVALSVHLDLSFIDERFRTFYSTLGAATAHTRNMTDQQRAEYQLQQLNLRNQAEIDRPIVSRHALAAAGNPPLFPQRHATNRPVPSALVLTQQQQQQHPPTDRNARSSRAPVRPSASASSSISARKTPSATKATSAAASSTASSSSTPSLSTSRSRPVLRRSHEVRGFTINLIEGDIVDADVECIVNAANTLSFTPMDGGISGALRRACQPVDVTGIEKPIGPLKAQRRPP